MIDNLSLTLNGNQLESVESHGSAPAYNGGFKFKNGASKDVEYVYDANGCLIEDSNKGIEEIRYNFLYLPSSLTFSAGGSISYLYDADGVKRRTKHIIGNTTTTTDYCGNMVYENGTLVRILTENGYITLSDITPTYHYYLKDHLGNNRVVVDRNGTVKEVNHYYPFGGLMSNSVSNGVQPYKYNGKELDRKNGLDLYDYSARYMDGVLGRFTTMDPLAEKYYSVSPYAYCANNPVNRIDPDGRNPIFVLYRAYRGYKAYRATRAATATIGATDAAIATATTATAAYSYNHFLNPDQAAKAQQSLLNGIESIANQNAAVSPEYSNQRKRERDARDKRNQEQANVAKSIDANVSGTMPNGDPAPKRDPNDGGNKTKIAIGVSAIGAGAAAVESVTEGTQPEEVVPQQPLNQPETKPQGTQQNNSWWQSILNLFQ